MFISWVYLVIAGIAEIAFAIFLKLSDQFSKLGYTIAFIIAATASFFFMSKAMKDLPISIVYAVWTGIGISGTSIFEMLTLGEINITRMVLIATIMACIIGLKIAN